MRWLLKLKLCFTDSRTSNSNLKVIVLLIISGLMLHLKWNLEKVDSNCEAVCKLNEDDVFACGKNGEVITKTSVRELGKPLTRKVLLTIGVPTIQRNYKNTLKSYLTRTFNSLLKNGISEDDLQDILIVVFLADTEKTAREEVKHELLSNFGKYIDMNVIHVISASYSFYPRLEGLKRTLDDSQERMYWRSKQTMDYVFMFLYSHGLAEYYMQLEDDVIAEPDYMSQIRSFIDFKVSSKWVVLRFSKWGFIAKLIHDDDLLKIGRFMRNYYNEIPCDWLLYYYTAANGKDEFEVDAISPKELFHHIGNQSSSLGT